MAERMNRERMVEACLHKRILKNGTDIARFDGLRSNAFAMCFEDEIVTWKPLFEDVQQD